MDIASLVIDALNSGDWAAYNSWPVLEQLYAATLGNFNWDAVGA